MKFDYEKMRCFLASCFNVIFYVFIISIGINTIFFNTSPYHQFKSGFILAAILLYIVLCLLSKRVGKLNIKNYYLWVLLGVYFIFQLCYFYVLCTTGGFDVSYVTGLAQNFAEGNKEGMILYKSCFEAAPNNLCCAFIYGLLLKPLVFLGVKAERLRVCLGMVSAVIVDLSIILTYKTTKKIVNQKAAILSVIVYILLFGFSHWIITPYTDSMGTLFTILQVYLYLKFREECGTKKKLYFLLMPIVAAVGFLVKPQIFIAFVAIIVYMVIFETTKEQKYKLKKMLIVTMTFAVVFTTVYSSVNFYLRNDLMGKLDLENAIDANLMLLFGSGTANGIPGVWNSEDNEFFLSIPNKEERTKQCRKRYVERIKQMGFVGYGKYLYKKINFTFSDGTFWLGFEGGGIGEIVNQNTDGLNNVMKKLFLPQYDEKFEIYCGYAQIIWLMTMIAMAGGVFFVKNGVNEMNIIRLSIFGLILFQLIFETRSRYLIAYITWI